MKKAIITGADGFIGRNLVWELLENEYVVYAVVMKKDSAKRILGIHENMNLIECDMEHYEMLLNYPNLKEIPVLFHFAWAGVSDQFSADYVTQLNNVKYSCDLQTVASRLGIKRLVFADSIMEYEHIKSIENGFYQVSLRNTYHVAKIAARNLIQLRAANMKMEFIPVVISNVYGVGETSARLINTAIRNLLAHKHMSFTSGEQLYDFIYISDAVCAIRMAAEKGINNKSYYIGNKEQIPLKIYLQEMRDILAPDMKLGIGELQMHGISLEYNEIDTCSIYEDLGFEPQYSFAQGIKMTADWILAAEKGQNYENNNGSYSNI